MNLAGYVTSPYVSSNIQARNGSNYNIHDTVSWLKGKHSFSFGMNYTQITGWNVNYNVTAGVSLGLDTNNDPAALGGAGFFTTGFFSGATHDRTRHLPRTLYALLTGRMTSISGTSRRNPTAPTAMRART